MKFFSKIITVFIIVLTLQNSNGQCDAPLNLTVSYSNITNTSTFSWNTVSASRYRFQLKFPWDA